MCYKELRETLKQVKDLKMRICCKAKKRNRRQRRGGRRVSRISAGCTIGRERTAVNSFASHEKSADFFSERVGNPFNLVGDSSPVIGEKMKLEGAMDIESLPLDILKMCYEKMRKTLKQAKTLKMKISCKTKKEDCGGRRVLGKRVSRHNAPCTRGRKRIVENDLASHERSADFFTQGRILFSQVGNSSPVIVEKENLVREMNIESLPLDILVQIICNFHHDEVKALSLVSSKFRAAVTIARKMHFDFSTPVRVRANKRRVNALMPNESSEDYARSSEGFESLCDSTPATPNAPKQVGKFQRGRISLGDLTELPSLLFCPDTPAKYGDEKLSNQNHFLRSKGSITNRVLFVEDELCNAVARNRI